MVMEVLPGNGLQSTLNGAITNAQTTLTIQSADASKWPASGAYRAVLCNDPVNGPFELVKVTGGQGTATLTVTRAAESYNGTATAVAWATGTTISAVLTNGSLNATYLPLAGGTLTGGLNFNADNTYDIGIGVFNNRPRDLWLGRDANIYRDAIVSGRLMVSGVSSLGGQTTYGHIGLFGSWQSYNTTSTQYGMYLQPTFNSSAGSGTAIHIDLQTVAATFSTNLTGVEIAGPLPGTGVTVPNAYGVYISNMGKAAVTNAYGIYIQATSGAVTTNVGLYNGGSTLLNGSLTWQTDNSYDIGASNTTRPRNLYVGNSAVLPSITVTSADFNSQAIDLQDYSTAQYSQTGMRWYHTNAGANQKDFRVFIQKMAAGATTGLAQIIQRLSSDDGNSQYDFLTYDLSNGNIVTNNYRNGANAPAFGSFYIGAGDLRWSTDNSGDIGLQAGNRPRNLYLASYGSIGEITTPATPAAGNLRLYPKSDHRLYILDSTGLETPLGGGSAVPFLVYEAQAVTGATVTLPQTPWTNGVMTVDVNGQSMLTTRDWTISGAVITFTPALTADDVHVEYLATSFSASNYSVHFETTLTSGQNTVTLQQTPTGVPLLTRGGVVQYQSAGHYTIAGAVITLAVPIGATEDGRISVDYFVAGGGGSDAGSVNGYQAVLPTNVSTTVSQLVTTTATGQFQFQTPYVGVGAAPVGGYGLAVRTPITGYAFQVGVFSGPTIDATATSWGAAIYAKITTAAASFTQGFAFTLAAGTPTLGAGSAITSHYGLYVYNQGASGITNSYGIYVASQSGATNSYGIKSDGSVWVNNAVSIGGQSPNPSIGRNMVVNLSGNNTAGTPADQACLKVVPVFDVNCTKGMGLYFQPTAANGGVTMPSSWAFYIDGPNYGTRVCTNYYGLWIGNQGRSAFTNSYGIWIDPQSGSSGLNASIALGVATNLIRVPKNTTASISIEASGGYVMLMSQTATYTGANVYWDGTNWVPMNTAQNFAIFSTGQTGFLWYWAAAASVSNVSWVQKMSLDTNGNLQISGNNLYFQGGSSYYLNSNGNMFRTVGMHVMSDGNFYFNANGSIYLTWNGTQIGTSHPFLVQGAANSPAAYLAVPSRLGPQYLVYDNGGGNMYGLGIDNSTLVLIVNGQCAVRLNTYNGAYQPILASAFTVNSTLSVKHDVRSLADPLSIVRDDRLHGVSFKHVLDDSPAIGFVADYWHEVLPEVVHYQFDGMPDHRNGRRARRSNRPEALDYGAIGAITFEALKLYVDQTDTRLERAEARIAELEAKLAA